MKPILRQLLNLSFAFITLEWTVPTDPSINGYRLYTGVTYSGNYGWNTITLGKTNQCIITNLYVGTNYFIVTSININGIESIPSNELVVRGIQPPTGLRLLQY